MIDRTPGSEPERPETGQETSLGGASEWSTVPASPTEPSPSDLATSRPAPPASSLEPLPEPAIAPPSEMEATARAASENPLPPPPEYDPHATPGYGPVYGGASQQPPPPPPGYAASGGGYPPPSPHPYGGPGQPGYPPPVSGPPGQGITSTAAAALSYITFIPAVIFLVMEPYNRDRFVRFHAWQCIALTVVWVAIGIIFRVLGFAGLHLLWWVIHSFITLALFVFWLIALIKASQGQWYRIPLVGDLAQSFSGQEH